MSVLEKTCNTFWGGHGCSLPAGHDSEQEHPIHECFTRNYDEAGSTIEKCSRAQYLDSGTSRVSYIREDERTWGDWYEKAGALYRTDSKEVR